MAYKDPDYLKKWYIKNRDKIRKRQEEWRRNNSEKIRGYYRKNKKEILLKA